MLGKLYQKTNLFLLITKHRYKEMLFINKYVIKCFEALVIYHPFDTLKYQKVACYMNFFI